VRYVRDDHADIEAVSEFAVTVGLAMKERNVYRLRRLLRHNREP